MEKITFEYCIDYGVHFDTKPKTPLNVNSILGMQTMHRDTMFRLFVFLIENAGNSTINNTDILAKIWDKHWLNSSIQRLWQVIQSLKFGLSHIR